MTSKYVKILRETTPTEPTGAEFFYQQMEKNAEAIEGYEAILKSAVATGGGGSPSAPQTQSDGTLPTNENEMGAGPQPNEAPVINNITAWSGRNPDGPHEVKDTKCEDTAADRVLSKAAGLPRALKSGAPTSEYGKLRKYVSQQGHDAASWIGSARKAHPERAKLSPESQYDLHHYDKTMGAQKATEGKRAKQVLNADASTKTAEQYARITTPEGPAVVPMSQIEPLLEQIQQSATRGAIAGAGAGGVGGAIGGGLLGGFGARSLSRVLGAKPGLAQAIPTAAGSLLGAAGGGGVGTPAGAYVGHERAIGKGQEQLMELARQYMPPGAEKTGGVMDVLRNPAVQHTLFGAGAGAVGSGIGSAIGSQTPEGHAADIASHMVRGAVAGGAAGYGGHLMGLEGKATYVLPALLGSALGVQAFGEQAMPGRAGVFGVDRDDPRAEALASEVREMEAKTAAIPAIMKDPRVIGTAIGAAGGGGIGYLSGDPSVPGDRARATAIGTVLGGGMGALGGIMSRNSGAAGAMAKLQHEAQVREAVSKAELLKRDNTIDIGTRALKEIQEDDARRAQWSLGNRMSQRGTG